MEKNVNLCHLVGNVFKKLGDYESEIKCYEEAIKIDPNNSESLKLLNKVKTSHGL